MFLILDFVLKVSSKHQEEFRSL